MTIAALLPALILTGCTVNWRTDMQEFDGVIELRSENDSCVISVQRTEARANRKGDVRKDP